MPNDFSVLAAVDRDLATLPSDVAASALAAATRVLAQELDDPDNSATSKSMCARALRECMDRLREIAPAEKEASKLDELNHRRAARLGVPAA